MKLPERVKLFIRLLAFAYTRLASPRLPRAPLTLSLSLCIEQEDDQEEEADQEEEGRTFARLLSPLVCLPFFITSFAGNVDNVLTAPPLSLSLSLSLFDADEEEEAGEEEEGRKEEEAGEEEEGREEEEEQEVNALPAQYTLEASKTEQHHSYAVPQRRQERARKCSRTQHC